jgi:hypothetical protein
MGIITLRFMLVGSYEAIELLSGVSCLFLTTSTATRVRANQEGR